MNIEQRKVLLLREFAKQLRGRCRICGVLIRQIDEDVPATMCDLCRKEQLKLYSFLYGTPKSKK